MTKKQGVKIIARFLARHPLATLSTIGRGRVPEAALIAFAENTKLELFFGTMEYARKYSNLRKNPNVALVVGWDADKHATLQYEGVAKEARGSEVGVYKKILLKKKTPCTEEFLLNKNYKMFKVIPTWIALSDYTSRPPIIVELKF